jgi:hypothetical protein
MSCGETKSALLSAMRCRRDVADGAQRGAADLAHALGDVVRGRQDLLGLLVEHLVVVAEVRPRHVPVEVLGLEIEREHVGQQRRERARQIGGGVGGQGGGRIQNGLAARLGVLHVRARHSRVLSSVP